MRPDKILVMHTTGVQLHRQMPPWLRTCLNSAVIIGIFAMHQMVIGPADASPSHHLVPVVSTPAAAAHAADLDAAAPNGAAVSGHSDGGSQGWMSDCCGLLMLCLAMLAGAAALIFILRRASERIMWQLPPPTQRGTSLRLPPFQNLCPLQRSSILRC